jgi:hypothetical protein
MDRMGPGYAPLRGSPGMMGWTAPDGIYVPNWWMQVDTRQRSRPL